jgi:hypothetical protein
MTKPIARDVMYRGRVYSEIQLPAISTVHAVLDRHGLVSKGGAVAIRRRAQEFLSRRNRTISGARTTKASSCSPIAATAIR